MNVYFSRLGVPHHPECQANLGLLLVRVTIPPSSLSNITVLFKFMPVFVPKRLCSVDLMAFLAAAVAG